MQGKSNTHPKRNTSAKPYKYKFISKLIATTIIFLVIKYICTANFSFSNSVKTAVQKGLTHNTNIEIFTNTFKNLSETIKNPLKINNGE